MDFKINFIFSDNKCLLFWLVGCPKCMLPNADIVWFFYCFISQGGFPYWRSGGFCIEESIEFHLHHHKKWDGKCKCGFYQYLTTGFHGSDFCYAVQVEPKSYILICANVQKMWTNIVCKSYHFLAKSPMTLGRERGLEVGRLEFSWRKAAAVGGETQGRAGGERDSCENAKTQGLAWWLCWSESRSSWYIWQTRWVGALLARSPICPNLTFNRFAQKLNEKKREWSRLTTKTDMMVLLVGSLMLVANLPFLAFSSSSAAGADFEEDFVHRWNSGSLSIIMPSELCQLWQVKPEMPSMPSQYFHWVHNVDSTSKQWH